MRSNILALLCIALLFIGITSAQTTRLTYFVQHEDEQDEDLIEVSLQVEAQSRTLVEAIETAKKVANQVSALALSYCKENSKKGKGDCKESVEVSKFSIEPKYQVIRKESTFSTFVVSHEITVTVFYPDNIGHLVDSFLKYPELTLKGFEWAPLEEEDPEEAAVEEGLEQGEALCQQVGLSLGRVLTIEEILEDEPAPEEGGDEEEEQEEAPEITTYKFEVECVEGKGGKAAKK